MLVWLLAAAAAVAPIPSALVERYFSRGLFPALQTVVTTVSNFTPYVLLDVLIVISALWWLAAAVRDIAKAGRRRRTRALLPIAVRTLTLASAA